MHKLDVDYLIKNWPSNLMDGHLHYCVGLSGGIDSVALLHLFAQLRTKKNITLSAIHVNHGISPNADLWSKFCFELCSSLNIKLHIANVQVIKIGGEGLENSARKLRYVEYNKVGADVILLAHHADDQIETMLSQIMRGSNLHNSAAMLPVTQRGTFKIWRPLLSVSKEDINSYANEHHLTNIEDESNQDNQYLRNFLRNSIIPQLEGFDSHIATKLLQSINQIQQSVALNDELGELDLQATLSNDNNSIDKSKFIILSKSRQLNLLSYWIKKQSLPLPSTRQLKEIIRQISTTKQNNSSTSIRINKIFNLNFK